MKWGVSVEGESMRLTEAIEHAVKIGANLPDETICIYRIAPRKFEVKVGQNPGRKGLVQMIHSAWIHDGWYARNYPEWVCHLPNNGVNADQLRPSLARIERDNLTTAT